MSLQDDPSLATKFENLKSVFAAFSDAVSEGDDDRAFLLFLKFERLSELLTELADAVAGHKTHFYEEAFRVKKWMEFEVGLADEPGYCSDQSAAQTILNGALKWG